MITVYKKIDHKIIEKELKVKVLTITLFKKTNPSEIYIANTQNKKYIIKKGLGESIEEEYINHKTIYKIYLENKDAAFFSIPKPYMINKKGNYFVMEYIENANNFQELILNKNFKLLNEIASSIGKSIYSYHQLATKYLTTRTNIFDHGTMQLVISSKHGNKIINLYKKIPNNSFCIIFKDFKATNILVDKYKNIYFIDFQKINYYASYYYDLARFIDTTKIFTFVKNPIYYLLKRKNISNIFANIINSYKKDINLNYLYIAQKIHQTEHIFMKKEKGHFLNSVILQLIYKLKI